MLVFLCLSLENSFFIQNYYENVFSNYIPANKTRIIAFSQTVNEEGFGG